MTQTVSLKDNYAIQFIPDSWEKNISVVLVDEVNNSNTLLGVWRGGKWSSDSPINMSKMFQIMKQYPNVKRTIKKVAQSLKDTPEPSKNLSRKWSCFRRRVNVKVHNIMK
jgi:PhoPQ-activated pathogenicity-related protein